MQRGRVRKKLKGKREKKDDAFFPLFYDVMASRSFFPRFFPLLLVSTSSYAHQTRNFTYENGPLSFQFFTAKRYVMQKKQKKALKKENRSERGEQKNERESTEGSQRQRPTAADDDEKKKKTKPFSSFYFLNFSRDPAQ